MADSDYPFLSASHFVIVGEKETTTAEVHYDDELVMPEDIAKAWVEADGRCECGDDGFAVEYCGETGSSFDFKHDDTTSIFRVVCEDCWVNEHRSDYYTEVDFDESGETIETDEPVWYRYVGEKYAEEGWLGWVAEKDD